LNSGKIRDIQKARPESYRTGQRLTIEQKLWQIIYLIMQPLFFAVRQFAFAVYRSSAADPSCLLSAIVNDNKKIISFRMLY